MNRIENRLTATDISCAFDKPFFMETAFNLSPDSWQKKILIQKNKNVLLLCSRQSGKSTVCASLALHYAVFKESAMVLIVSATHRQAKETLRKVKDGLDFAEKFVHIIKNNNSTIGLSNKSRIKAVPSRQNTIRSYSAVNLMIIDEAAHVEDEIFYTVNPMLAVSKGMLIALSTPFGQRGWFYNLWANNDNWDKTKITANDCPRITDEFINSQRKILGDWWIRQEYFCEFVDSDDQIFSHELIMDAITSDIKAIRFDFDFTM